MKVKKFFASILMMMLVIPLTIFNMSAAGVSLSDDQQWIVGVASNIEYITENTYTAQNGNAANSLYWTSIAGGTRPDGTKYASFRLVEGNKLQVASAWYGQNVFFRTKGSSGKGTVIAIPEYSQLKEPYKKAIRIFNAASTDAQDSFYASYLRSISDANGYLLGASEKINIDVTWKNIKTFNQVPNSYLTDAEGNYIFDLVAIGANTDAEPDISGAAAWALQDYIKEGYGFLIGHDTLYGYGGVNPNPNYTPSKGDTSTPMYELNTNNNGHWNLNWLMGVNKLYTEASPYNAASMILNLGDRKDKSTLYKTN